MFYEYQSNAAGHTGQWASTMAGIDYVSLTFKEYVVEVSPVCAALMYQQFYSLEAEAVEKHLLQ